MKEDKLRGMSFREFSELIIDSDYPGIYDFGFDLTKYSDVIEKALQPYIKRRSGSLILCSTPRKESYFFKMFDESNFTDKKQ